MIMKIARMLLIGAMMVLVTHARPAMCEGWSLPNPFAFSSKKESKKTSKTKPSALDKIGAGTKNFFTKVGDTLTFKKSAPKKVAPQYAYPRNRALKPPKKEESNSWLGPLFQPEAPPPLKTTRDWMELPRNDVR